jgi:outer dense fiber protein 2
MIQRGDGTKSPVHIHLGDTTPVHVHVQKPKKTHQQTSEFTKTDDARQMSGNMRRSTVTLRPTSRGGQGSKAAPGSRWKTSLKTRPPGMKYSWQGASHRLDIAPPVDDLEDKQEQLSDLESDQPHNRVGSCHKRLNGQRSDVDSLKAELEQRRTKSELAKKDDLLETSLHVLREQEDELELARRKREEAELENQRLRRHMDSLCTDLGVVGVETDLRPFAGNEALLKKLVEAEVDGQAIADKAGDFTDAIQRLRDDKRLTAADSAAILSKHMDLLANSIAQFAMTNSALRCTLRDRHDQELNAMRLAEHRDILMSKLAHAQDSNQILKTELLEKDRIIADLHLQLNAQKDENVTVSSLQSSLNLTRAHLQKQLRQKDADCNRLSVQIRTLESQLAQERIEVDHLRSLLQHAKEKTDEDKEQLKRATRVQKLRASKSKDELEQMQSQILDREAVIADQRVEIDTVRAQYNKLGREKSQADAELSALKTRLSELESVMERMEDDTKQQVNQLSSRLHEKSTEAGSLRLDNDRLKTVVSSLESKLSLAEADILQLRTNLHEYETLIDDYRRQLNQSRLELNDSVCQLEEQKHQLHRVRQDGERDLDTVRSELEMRLAELEPLPELLRATEQKLRDASGLLHEYERRHIENLKHVTDITAKLEAHSAHLLESRQKTQQLMDENRAVNVKQELLEKKLESVEQQNRELISINAKRDETLHQINMRLEEKISENASLQRQLESAIADIRRQKDTEREHISLAERTLQARIVDLESQLSQTRAEVSRQKREKNEIERSLNSRLEDLKSRLEASHSTNRTMQNYVHFLKSAYASAFNDSTLTLNMSPPRTMPF